MKILEAKIALQISCRCRSEGPTDYCAPVFSKTTTLTEMRFVLCTWFGEFCYCCSLTALPGPAWVLLNKICNELISSLYSRNRLLGRHLS